LKLQSFHADADLVGRRIRIWWDLIPEADGELGQPGRMVVRRKTRDFDFPPAGDQDPFVIFDSSAFPPAGTQAAVVPGWESRDGANRIVTSVDSAWVDNNGRRLEILRRTTSTTFGPDGKPIRRRIELLDSGDSTARIQPLVAYYYRLSTVWPGLTVNGATDAVATATDTYGLGRRMYQMMPEVYRRYDVVTRALTPGADSVLEAAPGAETQGSMMKHGQLRRFVDLFGVALDFMRSRAEGLRDLHDVDDCDHRLLPLMAEWVGWDLSFDAPIPVQRHEIRYAAALYRISGTIPGCMIWVRRLTGWQPRIKEFARNVFFANQPTSVTIDTSNAQAIANLHKFEDQSHYSYDAGITDDHWFAYNAVGIFVSPAAGESSSAVTRKFGKLRNHLSLFLPHNVRGVVVLEVPEQKSVQSSSVNMGQRSQDQIQ
jgi:phage tail-like protein